MKKIQLNPNFTKKKFNSNSPINLHSSTNLHIKTKKQDEPPQNNPLEGNKMTHLLEIYEEKKLRLKKKIFIKKHYNRFKDQEIEKFVHNTNNKTFHYLLNFSNEKDEKISSKQHQAAENFRKNCNFL